MPQQQRTKSLLNFYYEVTPYEYTNQQIARQKLEEFLGTPDEYTGPPDFWHNLAMTCSRIKYHTAELAVVQAGQREWPENVDLLCDELQLRYTTSFDLEAAQQVWKQLESIDDKYKFGEWRYWAYGAIYHAKYLRDPKTGLELLDQGLRHVRLENAHNIIRIYRRVLIDSMPHRELHSEGEIRQYHQETFNLLESRYKLGIELGVENGHNLAVELAKLYQEQAASTDTLDYLQQASDILDKAESMYTGIGSSNYPVWNIYVAKVRILMAQRKYGEALKLLDSLPDRIMQDTSLTIMRNLAALMIGEKPPVRSDTAIDKTNIDERVQQGIGKLLTDDELLYMLVRNNEGMLMTLFKVIQRVQKDLQDDDLAGGENG